MKFDQKAFQYHEKASIQKTVADWCAEWIERDCSMHTGLELGAGTGLFTKHLALRGFKEFCATDLSPSMLKEGRARLPLVRWERRDAWKRDWTEVDRIYACSLLQWAPDPMEVLKQWRDSLRPSGRILACFFVEGSLREFSRLDQRFSAIAWRSESKWKDIFNESGLRILRSDIRSDLIAYSTAKEALRHIHDLGAISANRMRPSELKQLLKRSSAAEKNEFNLSWRTMRIECECSR